MPSHRSGRRSLSGGPAASEKLLHRTLTVLGVAIAGLNDIATVDVEPGFSHGVPEPVGPLVPDVIVVLAWHSSVEDPDIAMTQREQVLGDQPPARSVIDEDPRHAGQR